MNSRSLICWSIPPLTTKVGLNSPQYLINLHMDHYEPNSKLCQMWHTPPQRNRRPHRLNTPTTGQTTTRNVPSEHTRPCVQCRHMCHAVQPRRAYTHNEHHVHTPNPHAPVATKVGSDTICNAPESKRLRSTLYAEWTTPTTIPLMLSSSLCVKGLTRWWWDELMRYCGEFSPTLVVKGGIDQRIRLLESIPPSPG
jgi:hypothetical protein